MYEVINSKSKTIVDRLLKSVKRLKFEKTAESRKAVVDDLMSMVEGRGQSKGKKTSELRHLDKIIKAAKSLSEAPNSPRRVNELVHTIIKAAKSANSDTLVDNLTKSVQGLRDSKSTAAREKVIEKVIEMVKAAEKADGFNSPTSSSNRSSTRSRSSEVRHLERIA